MKYLSVTNLDNYQHYKNRNMVWIKWYIDSFQDFEFMSLKPEEKWIFIGLICLACKCNNRINWDEKWLGRTLNVREIGKTIRKLLAIKRLSRCYQPAIPIREEKIREEKKESTSFKSSYKNGWTCAFGHFHLAGEECGHGDAAKWSKVASKNEHK